MSDSMAQFDRRLRKINKQNDRLATGKARHVVGKDGLIVVRRRWLRLPRWIMRLVAVLLLLALVFKVFTMAQLGSEAYAARLDSLPQETILQKAGAFLMQPDPVTGFLAQQIGAFF